MEINPLKISYLTLCFFLVFLSGIKAQEGSYITISGMGQYTKLNNADDFAQRTERLIPEDTYHPAFSVKYTYNYQDQFGLEAGLVYSIQGQKYSGNFRDSLNGDLIKYTSEVTMRYLKIPLKFRFNSSLDADIQNVYLSIGAGFSIDILTDVSAHTDPGYSYSGEKINYMNLYKNVSGSFVADATFNIKLSEKFWLKTGIDMSFGLGDIENKGFVYPDNAPLEWYFPLSTKKLNKPDLQTRERTRHSIFGIEIGLAYKFNE